VSASLSLVMEMRWVTAMFQMSSAQHTRPWL
jgi:hypothetical protein